MIFAIFFLQSVSIAFGTFGTSTNVHDIETLIRSYLSDTIDEYTLHATSHGYMKVVQDESHLPTRYFQAVRYILHGFPMYTNDTNDNSTVYKKLNFIQSIALYYCGMNISYIINTSFDNILINESELHLNSSIFPVQMVESYELIRSEICERIELGLYQSVVDMFNPYTNDLSFFSAFIETIINFISCKTCESFSLKSTGLIYPFLAKFGEFDLYKETVIHQIWKIDSSARELHVFGNDMSSDIDICVSSIEHPKMYKHVTNILEQHGKSSRIQFFIPHHHNVSDFWYYGQMYQLLTDIVPGTLEVESTTVEVLKLFGLVHQCPKHDVTAIMIHCPSIAFRIHESRKDGIDGHGYVINAIKCIISNHDIYYLKFGLSANEINHEFKSTLTNSLRQSLSPVVFYPYIDELMNDTQFVNIVNNNTDSEIDTYLQTILSKFMFIALDYYKDIQMMKKIATVFEPKINVCPLMNPEFMHLTKYFQQRFSHQINEKCAAQQV